MRKRSLLLAVAGVAAVVAAGVVSTAPRHRINLDTFELIKEGMTEEEVESILRVPYGQHFTGKVSCRTPGFLRWSRFHGDKIDSDTLCSRIELRLRLEEDKELYVWWERKGWVSSELAIWVSFSQDGTVFRKESEPVTPEPEPILVKLRRWLSLCRQS